MQQSGERGWPAIGKSASSQAVKPPFKSKKLRWLTVSSARNRRAAVGQMVLEARLRINCFLSK
ncbi:MAG: hypothetical protein CMO26_07150 [Thiotrichales bacterium]|nr:hypothetical protein [Thiotrichales bacterium]